MNDLERFDALVAHNENFRRVHADRDFWREMAGELAIQVRISLDWSDWEASEDWMQAHSVWARYKEAAEKCGGDAPMMPATPESEEPPANEG